jgi:hypothetical protein
MEMSIATNTYWRYAHLKAEALLLHVRVIFGSMQYEEFREDIQDLLNVQDGDVDTYLGSISGVLGWKCLLPPTPIGDTPISSFRY